MWLALSFECLHFEARAYSYTCLLISLCLLLPTVSWFTFKSVPLHFNTSLCFQFSEISSCLFLAVQMFINDYVGTVKTRPTCAPKVPASNLGQSTGHPEFVLVFLSPSGICFMLLLVGHRNLWFDGSFNDGSFWYIAHIKWFIYSLNFLIRSPRHS